MCFLRFKNGNLVENLVYSSIILSKSVTEIASVVEKSDMSCYAKQFCYKTNKWRLLTEFAPTCRWLSILTFLCGWGFPFFNSSKHLPKFESSLMHMYISILGYFPILSWLINTLFSSNTWNLWWLHHSKHKSLQTEFKHQLNHTLSAVEFAGLCS